MSQPEAEPLINIAFALIRKLQKNQELVPAQIEFELYLELSEKAKYAISLLTDLKAFPKVPLRIPKLNSKSTELRQRGNDCFAAKTFFQALELYNESICFAEPGSENKSIGYANRSAVYFEWQLYDRCLENIRLAKEANYPERLMSKLENRRVDCEKRLKMAKKKPVSPLVKLSYEAHPKIPCMVSCLDLATNDKFGRHVIAKRDLKVGDVLMYEKPINHILRPDYKYRRCATCLSENDLTLIPCPDCTLTMFCSPVCSSLGYEKFHKYECPVINAVSRCMDMTLQLPLRVILTLIHEYKSVDVLAAIVEEMSGTDSDYKTFAKYYDQAGTDYREMFKAYHMLENNIDKRTKMEMFQAGIELGHAYHLFIENTELKELFKTEAQRDLLLNLWYRYMFVCQTNNYSLDALARRPSNEIEASPFGLGTFLLGNLVNHSCLPNVDKTFHQTTSLAFKVCRPIKKGEQIFDSYGPDHAKTARKERRKNLKTIYKFSCDCVGCTDKYPTEKELLPLLTVPMIITRDDNDFFELFNCEKGLKNFIRFKKFVEKYYRFYPCVQVYCVQGLMDRSFRVCYGNRSLNTKV